MAGKKKYKGVFPKPGTNKLWLRFTLAEIDPDTGKRKRAWQPTDLVVGQEAEAAKLLADIHRQIRAGAEFVEAAQAEGKLPADGVTVRVLGEWWNKKRLKNEETHKAATEDTWKLEKYIYECLGHILVAEFRTRHGHDFVEWLKKRVGRRGKLSSRTIRSIWSCLHNLFRFAVGKELIPVNPCVAAVPGEDGQLPVIKDKVAGWRDAAVFERWEVERLISDERLPEWHRVLWALKFLAGIRDSEAYALRVSRYDARLEPLGRLTISEGWNTRHQTLGETKTGKVKKAPVHPTLAKILARWLLSGWQAHVGRKPGPGDLLIPNEKGEPLRVDSMLEEFRKDMEVLELRADRQQYDTRRTFKSLAEDDGASPEKIRWVMWGRTGSVEDGYSAHAWASFCSELAKLRVELLEGKLLELRLAAGTKETEKETVEEFGAKSPMNSRADIRTRTGDLLITNAFPRDNASQRDTSLCNDDGGLGGSMYHPDPHHLAKPVSLSLFSRSEIAAAIDAVRLEWIDTGDKEGLRGSLAGLLEALAGAPK